MTSSIRTGPAPRQVPAGGRRRGVRPRARRLQQQRQQCPRAAASSGKVTLTFWSWVPGISQSVNLWNKTHPDIHVNLDEMTSGAAGTYAKMFSALQAGNAPDLGQIEYATLPNFEHVGGLVNLSPYGADSVKQDFVPWTWGAGHPGQRRLRHPPGHRPDGAVLPRRPVQEVRAHRADDLGAVPGRRQEGARRPPERLHRRVPVQRRASGSPASPGRPGRSGSAPRATPGSPASTTRPSQQVASFWQQLISDHLVKVDPDFTAGWYKDLSDGTLLTWPTAVWGENTLVTNAASTKGDWRVASMPNWGIHARATGTGAARPRWCSRTASTRPRRRSSPSG